MSFSDDWQTKIVRHLLALETITPPTSMYAGWHSHDEMPVRDGAQSEMDDQPGYNRILRSQSDWNGASGGKTTSATYLKGPRSTAAWSKKAHALGLYESLTNDDPVAWAWVSRSGLQISASGRRFSHAPGQLEFQIAGLGQLRDTILNWLFRGGTWTASSSLYLSRHNGDPGQTGANEVGTRVQLAKTIWSSVIAGQAFNDSEIDLGTNAGSITSTHLGFWTQSTGGVFAGPSKQSRDVTIPANRPGIIPRGALILSIT